MKLMNLLSVLVIGLGVVCISSATPPAGYTEADCTQRDAAGKCTGYAHCTQEGNVRHCVSELGGGEIK